ncbi:MAG: hypothetical protein FD180_795 [Planctomycetota bacterium]|nr:MAG: hypothetical protein FD180_795 [Planctomycetota bacterium]
MKELFLGVRELQAHIGQALKAVREGRRVVVTSRSEPVAEIVKPRKPARNPDPVERKLDRLAAEGWLHRGNGKPIGKVRTFPLKGVVARLMADRR